jgi:hypothetical protein
MLYLVNKEFLNVTYRKKITIPENVDVIIVNQELLS